MVKPYGFLLQDAKDDIEGAIKAGLKGILVQTGKYRTKDERHCIPKPTCVARSFAYAVRCIEAAICVKNNRPLHLLDLKLPESESIDADSIANSSKSVR